MTISLIQWRRFVTTELIVFVGLWFIYGMVISSANLTAFTLQQAGVESIVERYHFYVEGSRTAELVSVGDTFMYQGHQYANKHPGQFLAGALVYFFLNLFGLQYATNYLLVSALVTFFSASLVTAASGAAVYKLARGLLANASRAWPIAAAVAFGLGTTAFAYSGIAHHDSLATGYLIVAFYLIFDLGRGEHSDRRAWIMTALAGFLLGFTLTTSMLHFFMAVVAGLYFLSFRRWRLLPHLVGGGLLGLLPLFIYNAVNWGNPFLLPAVANYVFTGYDPEVFFSFSWANLKEKVIAYTWFITYYAPVVWIGLIGLCLLPGKFRREQLFIAASILVLVAYMVNVQGLGTCNYGPRYLLPMMPFAAIGVAGFGNPALRPWGLLAWIPIIPIIAFAILVNLVGAMQGAMFCNINSWAFPQYLDQVMSGNGKPLPLFPYMLTIGSILMVTLIIMRIRRGSTTEEPSAAIQG